MIGQDPNNLSWAQDDSAYGARLLSKMGWQRGSGLGKHNHGTPTMSISQRVRTDNTGIGAEPTRTGRDEQWTATTKSYEEALRNLVVLGEGRAGKDKKDKKEKRDKKDRKDRKRDKKDKERKKEKKEKGKKDKKDYDTNDTKSKEVPVVKTHRGKFLANKRVSGYSQDALRQILGG